MRRLSSQSLLYDDDDFYLLQDSTGVRKINRDLTKLRRIRERQKSNGFNEQNNNSARASRFFVHFFAVPA